MGRFACGDAGTGDLMGRFAVLLWTLFFCADAQGLHSTGLAGVPQQGLPIKVEIKVQNESGPSVGQSTERGDPALVRRPPPRAPGSVTAEGKIHLDVLVNDAQGKPVLGLEPWDFKLTDNGKPSRIMSFRKFDGVVSKPDPPVEVLLLIDEVNLPFQQVAFVRTELTKFLRQNGGKLAQPVSLMRLTDSGLRVQPMPTGDGIALVTIVNRIKGQIGYINPAMGSDGAMQRFQISERGISTIAENEARKPGRKLLIWIGPGWPMLDTAQFVEPNEINRRRYFDAIVELTNRLREARITVDSVAGSDASAGAAAGYALRYQSFVKGVLTPHEASAANLGLKVLVTQTGGRILGPGNDLAEQIDQCVAEANAFYRISFNPPAAAQTPEFHDLKLLIQKPGLTVRTNYGYYIQPPGN